MFENRSILGPSSLRLIGDGDDVDLLRSIEASFAVTFANDETAGWTTVGDIYQSLLTLTPVGTEEGTCSTMMAFHRVRDVLWTMTGYSRRLTPSTRLSDVVTVSPNRALRDLSVGLGIKSPPLAPSFQGTMGAYALIIGFFSIFASLAFPPLWPLLSLLLAGWVMVGTDSGTFGAMTIGDLSRAIAVRNFAQFAERGADRRPEQIWEALRMVIAQECDIPVSLICPDTRLIG
jgi:hypothetical protein